MRPTAAVVLVALGFWMAAPTLAFAQDAAWLRLLVHQPGVVLRNGEPLLDLTGKSGRRPIPWTSFTIAVVGASRHPLKVAHSVPAQMRRHGWRVIPVNPYADEIWDERCYATLAEIPEPVDLVNVFRPSEHATDVVREAIAIGAKAVWLQEGITSALGRRLAEEAGIDYVEDYCIAVERARSRVTRLPQ